MFRIAMNAPIMPARTAIHAVGLALSVSAVRGRLMDVLMDALLGVLMGEAIVRAVVDMVISPPAVLSLCAPISKRCARRAAWSRCSGRPTYRGEARRRAGCRGRARS